MTGSPSVSLVPTDGCEREAGMAGAFQTKMARAADEIRRVIVARPPGR